MNDLNKAIKFSTVHHFTEGTYLILSDKSLKKINKHINHNLKLLNTWHGANRRISLNARKTEIILFRPKSRVNITKHLDFRIRDQRVKRIKEVKYLGLLVDEFLQWRTHFTDLKQKLNQAIDLLSKICHHTSENLLKSIYFSLFNSHLLYSC